MRLSEAQSVLRGDSAPHAAAAQKGYVSKIGRIDSFSEHEVTGAAGERIVTVASEHRPAIAADPRGV